MAGTFLVVGLGEESFTSLTPEQVQKYTEHFKQPEQFINLNGQIIALPVEPENPLRTVEMTLEDDYGMIDGVLNNGRKGEEQEKAQGKAHRSAPEKRPSIRERLAEAKRECGERKPPGQGPAEEAPGARSGGWNGPSSSGRTAAAGTTRFARAVSIPASRASGRFLSPALITSPHAQKSAGIGVENGQKNRLWRLFREPPL